MNIYAFTTINNTTVAAIDNDKIKINGKINQHNYIIQRTDTILYSK